MMSCHTDSVSFGERMNTMKRRISFVWRRKLNEYVDHRPASKRFDAVLHFTLLSKSMIGHRLFNSAREIMVSQPLSEALFLWRSYITANLVTAVTHGRGRLRRINNCWILQPFKDMVTSFLCSFVVVCLLEFQSALGTDRLVVCRVSVICPKANSDELRNTSKAACHRFLHRIENKFTDVAMIPSHFFCQQLIVIGADVMKEQIRRG